MDPVMNLATVILIEELGHALARRFRPFRVPPAIEPMDIYINLEINYDAMDIDINMNDMDLT